MFNSNLNEVRPVSQITKTVLFLAMIFSLSLCESVSLFAQGNLLITPRRVVFDGKRRVVDLNLANTGKDTAKYNVSIVQYRMTDEGAFEEITEPDPGQLFADKNLRFFPRSVTLAPNESQSVKMQVVNADKLAPGEYRSHVYFRAVPKEVALGEEQAKRDTTSLSVQIIPIFGITIPVIIRVGELNAASTLSNLKLSQFNDTTKTLDMTINRTGNMSIYGDIKVVHISPSGKENVVGVVNGVAVYTPNTHRNFRVELNRDIRVDYSKGTFRVTFSSQSDTKPEKYAEAELKL